MIRVEGLRKSFRRVPVLEEVSLHFGAGEHVALVGANGAGKTTLVRCLLGEYRYEGSIVVAGLDPRRARKLLLQRSGFVPQLPPPLRMPVSELLRFAATLCGARSGDLAAVASRLGLEVEAIGRRPFDKLSGGQKQKLLIAIALGRETDLLLLDEPTANLDPEARHHFFELLAHRAERATVLLSSHRLDEIAPLVDRVVELDRGRVVLDDRVAGGKGAGPLACRVKLARAEPAMQAALAGWGFEASDDGRCLCGTVPGPDRLRFLAVLSRYAGALAELRLDADGGDR